MHFMIFYQSFCLLLSWLINWDNVFNLFYGWVKKNPQPRPQPFKITNYFLNLLCFLGRGGGGGYLYARCKSSEIAHLVSWPNGLISKCVAAQHEINFLRNWDNLSLKIIPTLFGQKSSKWKYMPKFYLNHIEIQNGQFCFLLIVWRRLNIWLQFQKREK